MSRVKLIEGEENGKRLLTSTVIVRELNLIISLHASVAVYGSSNERLSFAYSSLRGNVFTTN